MPRKSRFSLPGSVHHIKSRGIDGRPVFGDNSDRQVFLDLLASGIQQAGYLRYAWVLMDNHYHLAVRANDGGG